MEYDPGEEEADMDNDPLLDTGQACTCVSATTKICMYNI